MRTGTIVGLSCLALAAIPVMSFGLSMCDVASNVATAPARVMNKTLETNNIIYNYEWFHDAWGNFNARASQVKQFKHLFSEETDPMEKSKLRIEMAAIQQSCRDLAQRYNQNADKSNRNIFMGRDVPPNLDPGACE